MANNVGYIEPPHDNPGIILQARMTSSRFPNKNLAKIKSKPVIDYVIEECLKTTHDIVIAIPDTKPNDALEVYLDLKWVGINRFRLFMVYRGHEEDVLNRFMSANIYVSFDPIIRVCSDAVHFNHHDIDLALNLWYERKYYTRVNDIEVFSHDEMEYAHKNCHRIKDRENVLGSWGPGTVDYPEDIDRFNFDNDDPTIKGRIEYWENRKKQKTRKDICKPLKSSKKPS